MASRITQETLEVAISQGSVVSDLFMEVAVQPFAPPYKGNRVTDVVLEAAVSKGVVASDVFLEVAILPLSVLTRRRGWMMLD